MGVEKLGNVSSPWGTMRQIRLVHGLLEGEVDSLYAAALNATVDLTEDSVDRKPEFQTDLMKKMEPVHSMASLALPAVRERIEPYVRVQYQCPGCVVCSSLMRRYIAGERRAHPKHFDSEAYVTVVVTLNVNEFVGGLYLQSGGHVDSRSFVGFKKGDVVFHQYDLDHGVLVEHGPRYSLIFWIKDSAAACTEGTSPWYSAPAKRGNADAQFNLGNLLLSSAPSTGLKWMKKAAKQGHLDALTTLAAGMLGGNEHLQPNPQMAAKLNAKAANRGYAIAQFNLGLMYHQGAGVQQNNTQAATWFELAANQGHTDAMTNLGMFLVHGMGVKKTVELGVSWLQLAANRSNPHAQLNLGRLYQNGEEVPQDSEIAMSLITEAARQGLADAQIKVGELAEDDESAAVWFRKAADQGNPRAQLLFGISLMTGAGVPRDPDAAQILFREAAEQGLEKEVQEVLQSLKDDPNAEL